MKLPHSKYFQESLKVIFFMIPCILNSLVSFSQPPSGDAEIDRLNKLAFRFTYDESKRDSLFIVATQMKKLGHEKNNEIGQIYGHRFCGLSLAWRGMYEESLKEEFIFLDLTKKFNRPEEELKAYGDMGFIYMDMKRYQEAKEIYLVPTRNEALIKSNPKTASAFFTNLGVAYKRENKLDSALMMYEKSLELKAIAFDTLGTLSVMVNLAVLHGDMGNFSKAKNIFKENIAMARKLQNKGDLWHNLSGMAVVLLKNGELNKSIALLNEALSVANEIESKTFQLQTLDIMAQNYTEAGQFKKAFEAHKKARELSESYLNEQTNARVSQLRETFNAEERETENKLLNQELNIQKTRQYALAGGLGFLAVLVLLAFFAWRKNERKNVLIEAQKNDIELLNTSLEKKVQTRTSELFSALEEIKVATSKGQQKERKRLASDLHDNLGSVLSAISMNLEALDPKALNEREQRLYANIKTMTSDAYNDIRLISHNLSPKELDKKGGLKMAIERLIKKLNAAKKTNFTFNHSLNQRLPQRTNVNIYAIVLELTNNVLRHADAQNALIILSDDAQNVSLRVSDDGIGFTNIKSKGLGISSILTRVEELNGKLSIDNSKGSDIKIKIPLS
ncbi:tetratricopeptide repeat protein [uncultured Arcticibacterium sp.]|uniref:tetratricopeptide repeat-containing sensor histidine kinase n=1 Tax=uncultured Arcticibacterium sp. TaxID=2173042 RepID=UPI0030FCE70D